MSLVSSVYSSRRQPINRQALSMVLPTADEYRLRKPKKKNGKGGLNKRKPSTVPTKSVQSSKPQVLFQNINKVFDGDKGSISRQTIEKIEYVTKVINGHQQGMIRLRISGVWYSVAALIDGGLLCKDKWKVFTGLLSMADCIAGVCMLLKEFGFEVPIAMDKRYKDAQLGLVSQSKYFRISQNMFLYRHRLVYGRP